MALKRLPKSISAILTHLGEGLKLRRNANRYAPLEALQADMERQRVLLRPSFAGEGIPYDFKGWDDKDVASVAALKGFPKKTASHRLETFRYGCSCGQCKGGFLSKRMSFALQCRAEEETYETNQWLEFWGDD